MKLIKISFYLALSLLLLGSSPNLWAKGGEGTKRKVLKTNGSPAATKFNINNVSTFFSNNGASDLSNTGDAGFQFPIGSGHTVFYESGFLYGGYVNGEWRVGGSTYNHGQVPGRILADGTGEDPEGARVRIYRVRRDYADPKADYSKEITDEGLTKEEIYAQYDTDWKEWPADYGAPYEEVNGVAGYQADGDIPGVPGADQTIWFVCNDTDPTIAQKLYGSVGLGIEMQATIWGYNQQNALGDALFRKYLMINKGGNNIDSCYVNMWSDPDLGGDAGDDFAGCDTTLSIGFIYNGDDSDPSYGSYIPASGFDFLQGPVVPGNASDQAIFKGQIRDGYRNIPMTAFYIFTQGVTNWGDPTLGNYTNGALRVRNLFEGKIATLGTPFTDPLTGKTTKFCVPGDPVTGQGWVDGILFPKQDRRMGAVSGPFTLAAGDTQEVVVGQLAAGGVAPISRLGAVALLKYEDLQVQQAYNNFFKVPTPPKAPLLSDPGEFDQQIVLTWGNDLEAVKATEGHDQLGYKFQGYVVYQLPSLTAQLSEGVAVATYDLDDLVGNIESLVFDSETNTTTRKFTKFGTNSGIKRYIEITKDAIRGGVPLANGTHYYFVVSAYSFNPDPGAVPNVLETLSQRVEAVPHTSDPGTQYDAGFGSAVEVTANGLSDGSCNVIVIDPSKVTGDDYKIEFYNDNDGNVLWKLSDLTTGTVKAQDITNQSGDNSYPVVDGLMAKVMGPSLGVKSVREEDPTGKVLDSNVGPFSLGKEGFVLTNRAGVLNGAFGDRTYDRFQYWGTDDVVLDFTQTSLAWDYSNETVQIDAATGQPYEVPFAAYRIKFPSGDKVRLFAGFWDTDASGTWNNNESDWTDPNYGEYCFEPVYCWQGYDADGNEINYDPANNAQYIADNSLMTSANTTFGDATGEIVYPYITATLFGMYTATATLPLGNIIRFTTNKPNSPAVNFTYTAPNVTQGDDDLAKTEVEKINVFPNPYYGVNPREVNKYQRFVTFSHLPAKATLRVFNLAGQLVRILHKDSPSQFTTWDLLNDNSFPVSSGIYIVHIDMPDLGTTKIVKLAVIQEQQVLDHY